MLLQLNIKNFALIEELSIEFDRGFNVFTGETGSGKSILIDAISYVLGEKFNKNCIRTGKEKTYVEGIFTIDNEEIKIFLDKNGIDYDDLIIISRETFRSGRSIAKINGKSLILSQIRKIASVLMDIHGQHNNQHLLNPSKHIMYLDWYGKNELKEYLTEYEENYNLNKEIEKKIRNYESQKGEANKKLEFIKYQIQDIDSANLKECEEEELKSKFLMLSNAEKLDEVLNRCHEILYNSTDSFKSVYDNLDSVIRELKSIETYSKDVKGIIELLENSYYNVEQSINDISEIRNTVYYDKNEIDYVNERLYKIERYKNKYGENIKDILDYRKKLENEYYEIENSIDIVRNLRQKKKDIDDILKKQAKKLHETRCLVASKLEKRIHEELNFIGLEKSKIKINVVSESNYNSRGCDNVKFYISTNPGEPLKPLESVISGGELSRIMLALKTVFIENDNIPTVIFDEIDTGISGRIAQCVGEKMYQISRIHQVFCITHLPQIASMSDHNYLVSKKIRNNKAYTLVTKMTNLEKLNSIAKMIGGSDITDLAIEHSKEMIGIAKEKKKKFAKS